MRICLVVAWLFVASYTARSRVIIVNNDGADNDECCGNGACPCNSLSNALQSLTSNKVIKITSDSMSLGRLVSMGSRDLHNVTITGNDVTIKCDNAGAIYCASCNDVTIDGITFDQCGQHPQHTGGLKFENITNIVINNCTFRSSQVSAVTLLNANGNVTIEKSTFTSNFIEENSGTCAGLCILYGSFVSDISLRGNKFSNNGYLNQSKQGKLFSAEINLQPGIAYPTNLGILINNTSFVKNTRGLSMSIYSCTFSTVKMSGLSVRDNTEEGIFVYIDDGCQTSLYVFGISSSIFKNNTNSLTFLASAKNLEVSIAIFNSTFAYNAVTRSTGQRYFEGALSVILTNSKSRVLISNCSFLSNIDGAIGIRITPPILKSNCSEQRIDLHNLLVYNTTTLENENAAEASVSIITENSDNVILITEVKFELNNYNRKGGGVLLVLLHHVCEYKDKGYSLSVILLESCTFVNNTAIDTLSHFQIGEVGDIGTLYLFYITKTVIDHNIGHSSIVYFTVDGSSHDGILEVSSSNFTNNVGTVIACKARSHFQLSETVYFLNNTADTGAAIFIDPAYEIAVKNISNIHFINNHAKLQGGAIYIRIDQNSINNRNMFSMLPHNANVSFVNNTANLAGNSIFLSISKMCNVVTNNSNSSLLYVPNMFNYSPLYNNTYPVITSPVAVKLHPPMVNVSDGNHYTIPEVKMLGEVISFTASVYDYFNHTSDPVSFYMSCDTCGRDYTLSKSVISVADNSTHEFKIFPTLLQDVNSNMSINIILTSIHSAFYKQITASLEVNLCSCHGGYHFETSLEQPQCMCYPHSDTVQCNKDYSEIKVGYWLGNVSDHFTTSICPNNYCKFAKRDETSPGYYELPRNLDEQCNLHREGIACGECVSGYTLAYDSPVCIDDDKCSPGMTVVVVLLTIIYWLVVVAVVFVVMYLNNRVLSGYVYGIIYYYSIVDILLGNNLCISEGAFHAISIISSFAKLTPNFFGKFCFVKGFSGIDQQFINYFHAVAISLIIISVTTAARCSLKITHYISRCIIPVICLLILLSYTSLASTSLQLLRPLTFRDIKKVRTFLSPKIIYFTDRHLIYALIALLCEVVLVMLPLFLLFEPLIKKKITLTRIKPLLDQFQGCYKDNYSWFAAYYLICRQVIILIVYVGNTNYYNMLFYLQTACIIIAMVHTWIQPYKDEFLNVLDGIFLLILVLVVSLNTFSASLSSAVEGLAIVLVLLPLLVYLFVAACKLISKYINTETLFNSWHRLNGVDGLNQMSPR